ncbi:transposase [Actinomyces bovis]|uniref:transposase n=1 Tax=Actinomyces bovis TaxID=1658 RepID=UPI000DCFEC0F
MKASGSTVAEVCRDLGASEATYHRWVKQYGSMSRSEARRFNQLQEENAKLKRLTGGSRVGKNASQRSWRKQNSEVKSLVVV